MKNLLLFFVAVLLFSKENIHAQDLYFGSAAPSVSITGTLKNHLDINLLSVSKIRLGNYDIKQVQYRSQVLELYSQLLLSYKINAHWQIAGGYGFQRNNPFDDNWRNEHRLVQQVSFIVPGKGLRFYNRFRLEERWFSYPTASSAFGTRARYQAGLIKKLNTNNVYWQINDELYAITSGPGNSFLSENWIYTGIGFPIKSLGHWETGFGYNSVVRNTNKDLLNLLLLQVSWSYIFPSAKMKTIHPVMHSRHF
ncbi:MAG: DUF2490 domain-containing protein [Chitinophagaceae bacterium]|nr:DUF2490 domain-containing protein [Chitinophagaceae bacterium]